MLLRGVLVIVLGIDPGATTGWCVYDSEAKRVVASGKFAEWDSDSVPDSALIGGDAAVVERPKGYGPTRPQLVDCGYVCGRIVERLRFRYTAPRVHELTRLEVCKTLTEATHGEVRVRNDATAWASLKLLHGDGCDKKGGALYGVKSHERAALAVAVAWAIKNEAAK